MTKIGRSTATRVIGERLSGRETDKRRCVPTNPAEMLREETDNERLDCAVPKADVRAINNHRRKACVTILYTRDYADDKAHISRLSLGICTIRTNRRTTALLS